MARPVRPRFVLFGSSIVQFSYAGYGWGNSLAVLYSRKADIFLRGYAGWNSRKAVRVLDEVFPLDQKEKPSLVLTYFGGNDSAQPQPDGSGPHVPLPEFSLNMRKIITRLQNLSNTTRILILTPPPINEKQIREHYSDPITLSRTNEITGQYAAASVRVCQEMDVKCIDLWTAMQEKPDWLDTCFTDGIHLSDVGSQIVLAEILKAIKEATWVPSLHFESMPDEFEELNDDSTSF